MPSESMPSEKDADALALALGRVLMSHSEMTLALRQLHKALCGTSPAIVLSERKETWQLIDESRRMLEHGVYAFDLDKGRAVLKEAADLNAIRNKYAHGVWTRDYDDKRGGRGELVGRWRVMPLGKSLAGQIPREQTAHVKRVPPRMERARLGVVWLTFACSPMSQWESDAFPGPLASALEGLERWEPAT